MFSSNPSQKPIENDALSAKWNAHIWNRLRECYSSSSLYTGTLKTPGPQRSSSNFWRLKFQLKLTWQAFAIQVDAVFKTPQSNREMRAGMPHGGRRPSYFETQYLVLQACTSSTRFKLVTRLLQVRTVTFSSTLHENGSLHGQWPRIWAGAGGEPSDAQGLLAQFQDIILFRRQQPLTVDSLI